MTRRIGFHWAIAVFWAAMSVPAYLCWRDSVLFVIAASVFANVYAAISAAEASDDTEVVRLLKEIRAAQRESGT